MRRKKRQANPCPRRTDGARVHRTRPLVDSLGDLVGHGCPCGRLYTPAGNTSYPGTIANGIRATARLASR